MRQFVIAVALSLCVANLKAQITSSHDGFYVADSVFYQLSGTDSFKYCVNCYSADSLRGYRHGIWLYSREHVPNSWENSQFSKKKNLTDTSTIRADVVKGNTVWVRIFKNGGYTDEHHLVFLGGWKPKASELVSIFLDSSEFIGRNGFYGPGEGMMKGPGTRWNYRLKIEKKCSFEIFAGPKFKLEAKQSAGLEISAQESADYPDKAMQLNANQASGQSLSLGKSLEQALGGDIKILRFRLGGSNHRGSIIANEIATGIIRPEMGGMASVPVCVFVNGSFWTYAMAEEGMGPAHISKVLNVPAKKLVSAKVPPVVAVANLKKMGLSLNLLGNSVYTVCGFFDVCPAFFIYNDTLQFHVDSADAGSNALQLEALCKTVYSNNDSIIASDINRESFYRYALSIWFFQNGDSWGNHLTIAKADSRAWQLLGEHYDFAGENPMASDWDKYFTKYENGTREALPWRAAKKMLSYDRDYFCLVFEDELNTTYKTERAVPIAQQKILALRPCVAECSKAWWPNDWLDSVDWENRVSNLIPFLEKRPDVIAQALPKIFMADSDTLWGLKDRNTVAIHFTQVPGKDVTVKLNSLEIQSDFTGSYFPKPDLRISLEYDPKKYEFVKWIEYPDASSSFILSANKPIALTPVLRLKK